MSRIVQIISGVLVVCLGFNLQAQTPSSYVSWGKQSDIKQMEFFGENVKNQYALDLSDRFSQYEIVELNSQELTNFVEAEGFEGRLQLNIADQYHWDLSLFESDLIAEDVRVRVQTDAGIETLEEYPINFFKGHNGVKGRATLTINEGYIFGAVEQGKEEIYIEPVSYYIPAANPDHYLIYKAADLIPLEGFKCGVTEVQDQADNYVPLKDNGACVVIELAIAGDNSYTTAHGGVAGALARATSIIGLVSDNYDDEFSCEIRFEIVDNFFVTGADPWTASTDAGVLLNDFSGWGGANFSTHDLGELWTTRNLDDGAGDDATIGLAWTPGICANNFKYHVLEEFSQGSSAFVLGQLRVLTAHEIGHNLNAGHDGGNSTIMAATVNTSSVWSAASVTAIDNHVNSINCLQACPPDQPPVAAFSWTPDPANVCMGGGITFVDETTNSPTIWAWSFSGAGVSPTTSTDQNPTVTVSSSGTLMVTLTATNGVGFDNESTSFAVTVDPSCQDGCIVVTNVDVDNDSFTVLNSGSGFVSGTNNFGDIAKADYFDLAGFGLTGVPYSITELDVLFGAYDGAPTGTVDIVIWDEAAGAPVNPGTVVATVNVSDIITVVDNATWAINVDLINSPFADADGSFFVGANLSNVSGGNIGLMTNSDGETTPATAWELWSDGTTWLPYDSGSSWGFDMAHAIFVELLAPTGVASFDDASTACAGTAFQMNNTSTDVIAYSWEFDAVSGGATTPSPIISTVENPLVTFPTEGTYNITLTTTDGCGMEDVATQQIVVGSCAACPEIVDGTGSFSTATSCNGDAVELCIEVNTNGDEDVAVIWTDQDATTYGPFTYAPVKHTITQSGITFVPATLNAAIGDTIEWVWTSGFHTTTCDNSSNTSLPAGATAWDSNLSSGVPSFEYIVGVAGTYDYKCSPHEGLGMLGTITVGNPIFCNNVTLSASGCAGEDYTFSVALDVTTIDGGCSIDTEAVSGTVAVVSDIVASANNGTCSAWVAGESVGCAGYNVTWEVTSGDNLGDTGTGATYNGANAGDAGQVTFTITAPSGCDSQDFVASFNCPSTCAVLDDNQSITESAICAGNGVTAVNGTITDNDTPGGSVVWMYSTTSGFDPYNAGQVYGGENLASASSCDEQSYYFVAILSGVTGCTDQSAEFQVDVYPSLSIAGNNGSCSASAVGTSIACAGFNVTWEVTAGDNLGDTGTGATYSEANSSDAGTVTFTVTNTGAASGCNMASATATFNCPLACAVLDDNQSIIESAICAGNGVTTNDGTITDNDVPGGSVVWVYSTTSGFDPYNSGTTYNGGNLSAADNCTSETYYFVAILSASGCQDQSAEFEVEVYPALAIGGVNGSCSASANGVSTACAGLSVTWEVTAGSNLGDTGTGITYSGANPGDDGTVTFTVTNSGAPVGCNTASATATFNCGFDCAVLDNNQFVTETSICAGNPVTTVDGTITDNDQAGGSVVWMYSTTSGFDPYNAGTVYNGGNLSSTDNCTAATYYFVAILSGAGLCTDTSPENQVDVYPALAIGGVDGSCSAAANGVTVDCAAGFNVTWEVTAGDNMGATGTGATYSGANPGDSGTVTFTVTNALGTPAGCQSASATADFNCEFDCAVLDDNQSVTESAICAGNGVTTNDGTITDNDQAGGSVVWMYSTTSGFDPYNTGTVYNGGNLSALDNCTAETYYFVAILSGAGSCEDQSAEFAVDVYPALAIGGVNGTCSASANGVSVACAGFGVTWEVTAGDNMGDTGTGSAYSGANPGDSGTITFTVANSAAPAGCNSASVTASFNCPLAPCPNTDDPDTFDFICDGGSTSLPTLNLNDDNGNSVMWFTDVTDPNNPTGTYNSGDAIDYPSVGDGCNEESFAIYPYIMCDTDGLPATPDVLVSISYVHTAWVYPDITATPSAGGCTASISDDCNLSITYSVSSDGANNGNTGVGNSFTANPGESGTVTITVSDFDTGRPAACDDVSWDVTFDCFLAPCPTTDDADSQEYVCDGAAANLPTLNLNDDNGGTVQWYLDNPPTTEYTGAALDYVGDGCNTMDVLLFAYISCDDDGLSATADILQNLAYTHTVTIYPDITATSNAGGCTASISDDCGFDITYSTDTGDSGSGNSYTSDSAESGTATFTVSDSDSNRPAACNNVEFEVAFDCPAVCSELNDDQSVSESAICANSSVTTVDGSITLNDFPSSSVTWMYSTISGFDPYSAGTVYNGGNLSSLGNCDAQSYYFVAILDNAGSCTDQSAEFEVVVYPLLSINGFNGACSANAGGVSANCANFDISWEVTSGDNLGDTGSGTSYSGATAGESGIVTFIVTNSGAPAACNSASATADFDCPTDVCSVLNDDQSIDDTAMCDGSTVTTNDGTITLNDFPNSTVTWMYSTNSGFDPYNEGTVYTGEALDALSACAATTYYFVAILTDASPCTDSSPEFSVDIYPDIVFETSSNECEAMVSADCFYDYSWEVIAGDNIGDTGNGATYTAAEGETSEVEFTISNGGAPADCSSVSTSVNLDCPDAVLICSELNGDQSVVEGGVCDGDMAITDDGTITFNDYPNSIVTWKVSTTAGFDAYNEGDVYDGEALTATGCDATTYYFVAILTDAGDCTDQSAQYAVMVYPDIVFAQASNQCDALVSSDCDYSYSWEVISGDNVGTTGNGTSYTAAAGETSEVEFTISNGSAPDACNSTSTSFNLDCPDVALVCSELNGDQNVVEGGICNGDVAITDDGTITFNDYPNSTIVWKVSTTSGFDAYNEGDVYEGEALTATGCDATTYYFVAILDGAFPCTDVSAQYAVMVYPDVEATANDGGCTVSVDDDCGFDIEWEVTAGDNVGATGIGSEYAAAAGESGTVSFTITNLDGVDGCNTASASASFDCPADPGSIASTVFIDADGNGLQDDGEDGLEGVEVMLIGAGADGLFGTDDDTTESTNTDENGGFNFANVEEGLYRLSFSLPDGYEFTTPDAGDDTMDSDVDPDSGVTGDFDIANGELIVNITAGALELDCITNPGSLDQAEIIVCAGGSAEFAALGSELADDEVLTYVVHTDAVLSNANIILVGATASYTLADIPGGVSNTAYYVSAVASLSSTLDPVSLVPDLSDPCTRVSETSSAMVFLAEVEIFYEIFCDNTAGQYTVMVVANGGLPSYDGSLYTASGDFGGEVDFDFTIGPFSDGTPFSFTLTDELGCTASVENDPVPCKVTPIELISFEGVVQDAGNYLTWETATEIDNDYFTLERSTDGVNFEMIDSQSGAGTSYTNNTYGYMDIDAPSGISYYRLSQTNFDGSTATAGDIVTLERASASFNVVSISPVPANEWLDIVYTDAAESQVIFSVYDVSGRLVLAENDTSIDGLNSIQINVSDFAVGTYYLSIQSGIETTAIKFVKQ